MAGLTPQQLAAFTSGVKDGLRGTTDPSQYRPSVGGGMPVSVGGGPIPPGAPGRVPGQKYTPRYWRKSDIMTKGSGFDKTTGTLMPGKEPWALVSRLNVAAGSQAVSTDLGDWLTTAATTDLTTNNVFPHDFDGEEVKVFVSGNLAASYVETLAVLAGMKVFERKNSTVELAQYPFSDLAFIYSMTGVVTSGAAAAAWQVSPDGVPFEAHYDIRIAYSMALRTVRAFTSVGTLDFTLNVTGTRDG